MTAFLSVLEKSFKRHLESLGCIGRELFPLVTAATTYLVLPRQYNCDVKFSRRPYQSSD